MTNPIKREKDTRQLMYLIFCFFVISILDFILIRNVHFSILILKKLMLFLNVIIVCAILFKTYKIIGTF